MAKFKKSAIILDLERAYLQTVYEHLDQAMEAREIELSEIHRKTKNGYLGNRHTAIQLEMRLSTLLIILNFDSGNWRKKRQRLSGRKPLLRIYRAMACDVPLFQRYYEIADPTSYNQIVRDIQECCKKHRLHEKIL